MHFLDDQFASYAFLESGKLVWERGGPGAGKRKDDLYPSYFLGAPLPVGGRLYALAGVNWP